MDAPRGLFGDVSMVDNAIRGVARRWHLDSALLEEWQQFAWLTLLERAPKLDRQFQGKSSPRVFLGSVLTHWCADWLKRERPSRSTTCTFDDVPAWIDRASTRAFIQTRIDTEMRCRTEFHFREAHAAWQHLDAASRHILLAYVDGNKQSRHDLAAALSLTPEALRQRFHRTLARLRQLMPSTHPAVTQSCDRRRQ